MIEIKGGTIGSKRDFLGQFAGRFAWPYDSVRSYWGSWSRGSLEALLTSGADRKSQGFGSGSHCD